MGDDNTDFDLDSDVPGLHDNVKLARLIAEAAAYTDDDVPQCLSLDASQLALLTVEDLPLAGTVSLPVPGSIDKLETPLAWARLYGGQDSLRLLVEHTVAEKDDPHPVMKPQAYIDLLYRHVLAWSRKHPAVAAIYRSEPGLNKDISIEYQVLGDGENLCDIAASALTRACQVERGFVEACERIRAAHDDAMLAGPPVSLNDLGAVDHEVSAHRKGKVLESLVKDLVVSVGGFRLQSSNLHTPSEELDLVFENNCQDSFMANWGPIVLVECKNWSRPVGAKEFRDFAGKVENRSGQCKVGIFVAWNGVTSAFKHEAVRYARESYLIILLEREGIEESIRNGNLLEHLRCSYHRAIRR